MAERRQRRRGGPGGTRMPPKPRPPPVCNISGNGLAEARMYAMVHVAIHDAVNAIDRRSRRFAFDAEARGPVSLAAAVAAAARDVLVSVISGLPESPECMATASHRPNASTLPRSRQYRMDRAKTNGMALGRAAAATIVTLRADDGSDAPGVDLNYPQGTEPA